MKLSFQLFHPNTCLISMGFVAVSTLNKTHFHVFSPYPNFELMPTHLELFQHPPQMEHPLFTWNIHPKFKQLF